MEKTSIIDFSENISQEVNAVFSLNPSKYSRKEIARKLENDTKNLAVPEQVHSTVVEFARLPGMYPVADGLVTTNPKILLTLKVADCVPVYLYESGKNMIGLVHSGWRGTRDKIIKHTVNIMLSRGSTLSNIFVVIGASIQKCCYEIGDEISPYFDDDCIYIINQKKYLSLQEQILIDLDMLSIPIENIHIDSKCTFMDINLSSYRRDKDKAGRMLSFLGDF